MKALNIMEATVYTSPNPLTLICSQNEDGTTNLAPICFVSYLSFNPPMVGFATGKQSHTGKRVRETSKVIVTVPGENLAGVVMACGSSTSARWTNSWVMRTRRACMPGTALEKLHPR